MLIELIPLEGKNSSSLGLRQEVKSDKRDKINNLQFISKNVEIVAEIVRIVSVVSLTKSHKNNDGNRWMNHSNSLSHFTYLLPIFLLIRNISREKYKFLMITFSVIADRTQRCD